MVRRGRSPLPGSPDAYISSVAHDDAATAVVAALELPAGAYNVTDDEPVRRREYVEVMANSLGVPSPRPLPRWITILMGSLAELLSRSERMSNKKLRNAAPQWAPVFRSVRDGLPKALAGRRD
jgi:nucleoside-diphosphate-sugar epimerase